MSFELWKIHQLNVVIAKLNQAFISNPETIFEYKSNCGTWNEIGLRTADRDRIINGEWDGRSPMKVGYTTYCYRWDYGRAWGNDEETKIWRK